MTSCSVVRRVCVIVLLAAGLSCSQPSGKTPAAPPRPNTAPASNDATPARPSTESSDRRSAVADREIFERVEASVPEEIRRLAETQFAHQVAPAEADQEFRSLGELLESSEAVGLEQSPPSALGAAGRIFAPWRRFSGGAGPSLQELDTDTSPRAGPDDEVLLHNGEVRLQQVDHTLPSRAGLGFTFARIYRSHVEYDGPLGPGWDHNHNQRLVVDSAAVATARRIAWYAGQRQVLFQRAGKDWQAEPGAFYALTATDTQICLETPSRQRLVFEPAVTPCDKGRNWRIRTTATRHDQGRANTMLYQYAAGSDQLREVVDPFGNRIAFSYTPEGRLAELRHGSVAIGYEYDAHGRLARVTSRSVALILGPATDVQWSFAYSTLPGSQAAWLTAMIPPGDGPRRTIYYVTEAKERDFGRVRKVGLGQGTDPETPRAAWVFSHRWDTAQKTHEIECTPPAPLPRDTFSFPPCGEREATAAPLPTARELPDRQARWLLKYNGDGLLVEEQQPLGGRRTWEYDTAHHQPLFRGNLLAERQFARPDGPTGGLTELGCLRKYHPQIALPVEEVSYEVAADGTRRELQKRLHQYDDRDWDLLCSRLGRQRTVILRNRFGLPVVEIDALGCATLHRYWGTFCAGARGVNRDGLLAETVLDVSPQQLLTELRTAGIAVPDSIKLPERVLRAEPVAQLLQFAYDARGQLRHETHPNFQIHTLYNKVGLLLSRYDTRADLWVGEYDAALRKTAEWRRATCVPQAAYQGEAKPGLRGRFYVQRFAYDAGGHLASWTPTQEPLDRTGSQPPVVRYGRLASGALQSRTTPAGQTVKLNYQAATGFVWQKTLVGSRESGKQLVLQDKLTYDKEGFCLGYLDDLGQQHCFQPDGFGRPFSATHPDGVEHRTFLDGLGRPVRRESLERRGNAVQTLTETVSVYDAEGQLQAERTHRLGSGVDAEGKEQPIDEWLTTGEFQYDESGYRTAMRSVRQDAWTRCEYDGLGRVISTADPEGDVETRFYAGDQPVVVSRRVRNQVQNQTSTLRTVTLFDSRCRPWLIVPVGTDGQPVFSRAAAQTHDGLGRLVQTVHPGRTRQVTAYDSLDRIVREETIPLETAHGEEPKLVTTGYDPDGRVTRRTVGNSPLAVFTATAAANAPSHRLAVDRVPVPQTMLQEYDEFGRLEKTRLPDGLEKTHQYNAGSMVEAILTTHAEDKAFRHVVHLEYDELRRVVQVKPASGAPLQSFTYDKLGHVTEAVDRGDPGCVVTVSRRYDNIGNLLVEEILPAGEPGTVKLVFHYALAEGGQQVFVSGIKGQREQLWQRMGLTSDRTGRVATVAVDDDQAFCTYQYAGSQVIRKTLAAGGVEQNVELSPLLEPVVYQLRELASDTLLSRTEYQLDAHGLVAASAAEVPQRRWQHTHFYQHDACSALVAEGAEDRLAQNLDQRRDAVLDDVACPGAWRLRWYRYDQVGNLTTSFRKPYAPPTAPVDATQDQLFPPHCEYYSPGRPVPLDLSSQTAWKQALEDGTQAAQQQLDLASNRLTTTAAHGRLGRTFEYDRLGRLTKFLSLDGDRSLAWRLEYDLLGRVTRMYGHPPGQETNEPQMELRFATDAFNRRIVKRVQDRAQELKTVAATTYLGTEPLVVMERVDKDGANWNVSAQYLWGPATREVLMAVLPAEKVELRQTNEWDRYFLHQDRMLNVFLCTGLKQGRVTVFDLASYWGFGENSTTGNLVDISCTAQPERGAGPAHAIDRCLDEKAASWLVADGGAGRLTLELDRATPLSQLTIWTDKFPQSFRVYVVPEGQDAAPDQRSVPEWEETARQQGWLVGTVQETGVQRELQDPHEIPLGGQRGRYVVIAWSKARSLAVREFEVAVLPTNPSCLAFSGSWLDKETGLYYHGARYRLPAMGGKFISPDPLGFLDGDNLYAYAHNDPLTWHDPNGQWAHILIGAGAGATLGGGAYLLQVWVTGEEFSWAKLGIYTGAGAVGGALTAATFGLASAYLEAGLTADLIAGGVAGGAGGAAHGLIASGGTTWVDTGDWRAGVSAGLRGAALEGAMGFVGGGMGGAALGQLGRSPALTFITNKTLRGLTTSVVAGAVGGGGAGAVGGGYGGYADGDWGGVIPGAVGGARRGVITGAVVGGIAFGIGKGIDLARPGNQKAQWARARRKYWKEESRVNAGDSGRYSTENLARMQEGGSPRQINPLTGASERMELHHNTLPQRSGLPGSVINERWNLRPVWPAEHRAIDPFRH